MKLPRASGILLHPTSLPNKFGIGDFGKSAYEFVDFLEKTKQTYWQMLPLGPTGFGDSPYQSFSAFAGNTNLISPKFMAEDELISEEDLIKKPDFPKDKVDFGKVIEWKNKLLKKSFETFLIKNDLTLINAFDKFVEQVADWLDDYALFRAIKLSQDQKPWLEWDESLSLRDEQAILNAHENLFNEIQAQKFYQFLFFKQWNRLKNYANGKGIKIIGDIPIFVSLDSADVWCNPQEFKLNEDLSPKVVAGVPPDYFSKTGQLWGNPIYNWKSMREKGFEWWISRVRFSLKTFDIVRIDHFRGFKASWEVPGNDKTAENGKWVEVPGEDLFRTLKNNFQTLPLIAEDLGVITDEVKGLRDSFDFPGMKILQYGFGGDAKNVDLPHNYIKNCVAYTGTHDNDTTNGWFESLRKSKNKDENSEKQLNHCLNYLDSDGEEINWDMIKAVWSSVANTAITPLQDVLGLDTKSRMNLPASKSGNWNWRYNKSDLSDEVVEKLKNLTELYGRDT